MRFSQLFYVSCFAPCTFAHLAPMPQTPPPPPSPTPWQPGNNISIVAEYYGVLEWQFIDVFEFPGCDDQQSDHILSAISDAKDILDVVLKARQYGELGRLEHRELLDLEHRYFGDIPTRRFMNTILEAIQNHWNQTQFVCLKACFDIPAFVSLIATKSVFLCQTYQNEPPLNQSLSNGFEAETNLANAATAILHEMTHQAHNMLADSGLKLNNPIIDIKDRYGRLGAQSLVYDNPQMTFFNADSWTFYALETYIGVRYGMPPRQKLEATPTVKTGLGTGKRDEV